MPDRDATSGFPPHDHAGRREQLRQRLDDWGAAGIYVTAPENVRYLTGFTGSNGQVLVTATGEDVLLTDDRYTGRAAVEAPDIEAVATRKPTEMALDRAAGRLAFESEHLTYHHGTELLAEAGERGVEAIGTRGAVEQLRIVKEESELARLRRACDLTVDAFEALVPTLRFGRTERDIAIALERAMVDLGADGKAFDLIVASGPNSAIPHHEPTGRRLEPGDLVKFDIGARVDGYHADMTRMVALDEIDTRLRQIYDVVQAAQAAGVEAATCGAACEDVDRAARSVIEDAGYGDQFTHGIGHGVGLQIHEAPIVTAAGSARLDVHTALTVEPGVYLPGLGGVRIEDTIVVTADGPPERLTLAPRDLLVL